MVKAVVASSVGGFLGVNRNLFIVLPTEPLIVRVMNSVDIDKFKSPEVYYILREFKKHCDPHGNYQNTDRLEVFDSLLKQGLITEENKPSFLRTVTAISDHPYDLLHHHNGNIHVLTDTGHLACLSWASGYEKKKTRKKTGKELTPAKKSRIKEAVGYICEMDNCSIKPYDIHHIIHKSKGGKPIGSNLIALCGNHHKDAHNGKITQFKMKRLVINRNIEVKKETK